LLELEYPDGVRDYLSGQLSTADVDEVMAELEKNVPLRRLTLNPLLLQLITTVYLRTGRLPDSRVKLLDGISWELLGRLEVSVESSVPGAAGTRAACGAECCHTLLRALGYAMRREGLELPSERVAEIFRAAAENVPPRRNEDAAEPPPSRAPHPSTDRTRLIDELVRARLLMRDVGGADPLLASDDSGVLRRMSHVRGGAPADRQPTTAARLSMAPLAGSHLARDHRHGRGTPLRGAGPS